MIAVGEAFAREQLSVSTVASLTAATFQEAGKVPAIAAYLTVSDGIVCYRVDGTNPPAALAEHVLAPGGYILLTGINNLRNFRAIALSGTVTLQVTYFR